MLLLVQIDFAHWSLAVAILALVTPYHIFLFINER